MRQEGRTCLRERRMPVQPEFQLLGGNRLVFLAVQQLVEERVRQEGWQPQDLGGQQGCKMLRMPISWCAEFLLIPLASHDMLVSAISDATIDPVGESIPVGGWVQRTYEHNHDSICTSLSRCLLEFKEPSMDQQCAC